MVNGYARIERLSFDAFNEAADFFRGVEAFRADHGCYPKRVLADKICRNRETIAWRKERGIQLTGPALGRPPKDSQQTKAAKRQAYQDICDRNAAEGEFGVGKRSYGLNRIMAHLPETSFCVIGRPSPILCKPAIRCRIEAPKWRFTYGTKEPNSRRTGTQG